MDMLKRSFSDRRADKDRRRILSLHRLRYKGSERRMLRDRRSQIERRDGWVKIGKWSSVKMQDLKIAKYLHGR
jgi:23S rRNA A2030 N6-methylase RlmJ